MLVTDCARAALFELSANKASTATTLAHAAGSGTSDTPGNCSANLHDTCVGGVDVSLLTPYLADISRVLPLRAFGFYVANTNRTDAAGNAVPALYRQRLTAAGLQREELLEGVTDLQVFYGVAPPNGRSAEKFVGADQVTTAEWGRVVAVRINLAVRAVNAPDLTRNFSTTVAVRNRTL
jgi:hypothetical protein